MKLLVRSSTDFDKGVTTITYTADEATVMQALVHTLGSTDVGEPSVVQILIPAAIGFVKRKDETFEQTETGYLVARIANALHDYLLKGKRAVNLSHAVAMARAERGEQ